jgi:hypothetical protein
VLADSVPWTCWLRDDEADLAEADAIEVGIARSAVVGLRSARNPGGAVLVLGAGDWVALYDRIMLGEADIPPGGNGLISITTREAGNPGLTVTVAEWAAFCDAVREQRFVAVEDYRQPAA